MARRFLLLLGLLLPAVACDQPVPDREVEGYDACTDDELRTEAHFDDVMLPNFFDPYCSYLRLSNTFHQYPRTGGRALHGCQVSGSGAVVRRLPA